MGNPLMIDGQPGYDASKPKYEEGSVDEYWGAVVGTPAIFMSDDMEHHLAPIFHVERDELTEEEQTIEARGPPPADPARMLEVNGEEHTTTLNEYATKWEDFLDFAAKNDNSDSAAGNKLTLGLLRWAIQTLRFRKNFGGIYDEFELHSNPFLKLGTKIKYDDVLKAFVQNRMGEHALTFEEQQAKKLLDEKRRSAKAERMEKGKYAVEGDTDNVSNPIADDKDVES